MKYLKQIAIILAISCLGELLSRWIPAPIPGSIYGIVLLFVGLLTKLVPYEAVKDTAHFLVEVMPVMFIPAGVGLLASWGVLRPSLLPVAVITLASLVTVLAVTGYTAQYLIGRKGRRRHG